MLKWRVGDTMLVAEGTTLCISQNGIDDWKLTVDDPDCDERVVCKGTLVECKQAAEAEFAKGTIRVAGVESDPDPVIGTADNSLPRPNQSACTAIEFLVWTLERDHGLRAGKTAFYWDLFHTVQRHLKRKK